MNDQLREMVTRSVIAQADDARVRRAWRDGAPIPDRIGWPEPHQQLPPAIVDKPVEPAPRSGLLKSLAIGSAVVASAAGIGAGGAYVGHLMSGKPAAAVPADRQAEVDVVQWLGEHGHDRPPE